MLSYEQPGIFEIVSLFWIFVSVFEKYKHIYIHLLKASLPKKKCNFKCQLNMYVNTLYKDGILRPAFLYISTFNWQDKNINFLGAQRNWAEIME